MLLSSCPGADLSRQTAYVFTGQGSQEQGMGMELYANSTVARAVWDMADAHLGEVYGFSILEIVRSFSSSWEVYSQSFLGSKQSQGEDCPLRRTQGTSDSSEVYGNDLHH